MKRAATGLGLLVLVASMVVGADLFGTRTSLFGSATPAARAPATSRGDAFTAIETKAPAKTVLRSQPWWQELRRFDGARASGPATFRISDAAIQWRVSWNCTRGRFVVRGAPGAKPLIDRFCAGDGTARLTKKATGELRIEAEGPWTARVEQQIDLPLDEPPLRAMSAPGSRRIATGSFYRIDQVGRGRMTFYRLADGRHALRLSNFYVTANIDLEIRLSPLPKPRTTRQYRSEPSPFVAPLPTTAGSMNFAVPRGVDPSRYRSVVIWCPLIFSAYAAATIEPVTA